MIEVKNSAVHTVYTSGPLDAYLKNYINQSISDNNGGTLDLAQTLIMAIKEEEDSFAPNINTYQIIYKTCKSSIWGIDVFPVVEMARIFLPLPHELQIFLGEFLEKGRRTVGCLKAAAANNLLCPEVIAAAWELLYKRANNIIKSTNLSDIRYDNIIESIKIQVFTPAEKELRKAGILPNQPQV